MSADLLARLIQAGTPAGLVAELAMELARGQQAVEALEQRRTSDRTRQANRRSSRDITLDGVTARDVADEPSPSPPSPNPPQTPQEPQPPLPHPGRISRARKGSDYPAPKGVTEDRWRDFCRQRKKVMTDGAYSMLCAKLIRFADAGWPPGEMIDLAIERGWETVFEPKEQRSGSTGKRSGWID